MRKVTSVKEIKNPYSKRILSNIIDKDPLRIYAQTPGELRRLTRGLTKKQLHTPQKNGGWSIAYLLSHFCDAELGMGFRIRRAIAQSGGPFQAYDQDKWAEHLYYDKADCAEKLLLFEVLRKSHVSLLTLLKPSEWRRYGIHEERGKETVERMVQMLAGHDINHLRQVKNIRDSLLKKS